MADTQKAPLRAGDVVTFKAIVTDVADYGVGEQQIQARILPRGEHVGWCIPKENAFEPHTLNLKVGDKVKMIDRPGHVDPWEVRAIFEGGQVAVQKPRQPVEMANAANLRRVA